MPRDIPVGNGNLLVTFDRQYRLRDFYFPYASDRNSRLGEHPAADTACHVPATRTACAQRPWLRG